MNTERSIRFPLLAGIFYPSDPQKLKEAFMMLRVTSQNLSGHAFACISPHGSFLYSGHTMREAWEALCGTKPETIVILGPSHVPYEDGVFLPESTSFAMPGAELNVDQDAIAIAKANVPQVYQSDIPHLEEHSIDASIASFRNLSLSLAFPCAMYCFRNKRLQSSKPQPFY